MAANRFATLIHRKTNRITLILVYVFLEWSLIFFIFLNSLFSYFILRFADYFGLKRPCLFCSRLDRFFDASASHRDLLCHDHALEIRSKPNGFGEFRNELINRSCCVEYEKKPSLLCTSIESDLGVLGFTQTSNRIGDETGFEIERFKSIEENVGFVRLIDSQEETEKKLHEEEDCDDNDEEFSCYVSSFDCNKEATREEDEEKKVDLAMEVEATDKSVESVVERNLEFYIDDEDCHLIPVEFYKPNEEIREISDVNGDFILDFAADEEVIAAFATPDQSKPMNLDRDDSVEMQNDEETDDAEVSIGTEIPDHDQIGDISSREHILDDEDDHEEEEDTLEFKAITLETRRPVLSVLESQDSMERLHSLHNAMFRLDRAESLDGMECCEGILTVDKLKSELQEERKALNALYEELEEERSASAIAADETMAMINRLHEEKAAMQMEALQYQRMMEEQSEFDQEALQLLNELMIKREKENAELEKELELYRKKLEEYEAKENLGMLRRRMSNSSADSCRNNADSDENNGENEMVNTPIDVVLSLDECLDDYEGERLSILGRLKFLEEKLTALNDEEGEEEEVKTFENNGSVNGNGHFHTNGKHRVIKSKRLLPLFDAVDGEIENGNHQENGVYESENGENVTVEEEVDELYERLEALEADREFLRHCVGSLKKGDKGVHLLHQILQHLRDLRNIDLIRVRENGDMTF